MENSLLMEAANLAGAVSANLVRLLPFLALSIPLAVFLNHSGLSERIRTLMNRGPLLSIFIATAVGAASPLCSCGVIPVIAALLTGGVPLGPVMSFWLASPSMDPEILVLSAGVIGWELALWRLAATFAMSLGAGLVTHALEKSGMFSGGILRGGRGGPADQIPAGPAIAPPAAACACSAAGRASVYERMLDGLIVFAASPAAKALVYETAKIAGRLSLLMTLAFLLEALIIRFIPAEAVAAVLGRQTAWAIPLATLVGVPMYATNLSALGLISGLLAQGMDPGAALAFFIGGAVTTIPAMSAVYGLVRPRVFGLYLGFAATGSLLAGYAWRLFHVF